MKQVTIYTDRACSGNPGKGGYGAILIYNAFEKEICGGFELTTNNRMEIFAAIVGLEALKEPCEVTLYSDSEYLVNTMMKNWRRKKNLDLWQRLDKIDKVHDVEYIWLRGHNGSEYNERADYLSLCGLETYLQIDNAYLTQTKS